MLRIAICDDDIRFNGSLEAILMEEGKRLNIPMETEVFYTGAALRRDIENGTRYDLIILDMEQKEREGITTAREIRSLDKTVLLIYISRQEEHIRELFELEVFRFLKKPFDRCLLRKYFKEAYRRIQDMAVYYQFTFKKEIQRVNIQDIAYFESRNRVVHIFLQNGLQEKFYGKLNNVERELWEAGQRFLRIHQSFLVNCDYIRKMNFSSLSLILGNDREIQLKISEDRQKMVRRQLCGLTV